MARGFELAFRLEAGNGAWSWTPFLSETGGDMAVKWQWDGRGARGRGEAPGVQGSGPSLGSPLLGGG